MPKAYPPVECVFPPDETFKHYDLKWRDYRLLQWRPGDRRRDSQRKLMRISAELFQGLGGSGYARCDIRRRSTGIPYMLEINPNCSVFYPPDAPGGADAVLQSIPGGHADFIETILADALARQRANRRRYVVQLGSDQAGYGMYAATSIAPGERISRGEEQPHTLVTAEPCGGELAGAGASAGSSSTAYPLNDEVLVTWSSDPAQWSPINHSCDPNAWLEGLDLVARRPIEPGEEITVEYATFIAGTGESFDCHCGAGDCRGDSHAAGLAAARGSPSLRRTLLGIHRRQVGQPGRPRCDRAYRVARRPPASGHTSSRASTRCDPCGQPRPCAVTSGAVALLDLAQYTSGMVIWLYVFARGGTDGHLAARDHRLGHGRAPRRADERPRRSLRPRADRRGRRAAPRARAAGDRGEHRGALAGVDDHRARGSRGRGLCGRGSGSARAGAHAWCSPRANWARST